MSFGKPPTTPEFGRAGRLAASRPAESAPKRQATAVGADCEKNAKPALDDKIPLRFWLGAASGICLCFAALIGLLMLDSRPSAASRVAKENAAASASMAPAPQQRGYSSSRQDRELNHAVGRAMADRDVQNSMARLNREARSCANAGPNAFSCQRDMERAAEEYGRAIQRSLR